VNVGDRRRFTPLHAASQEGRLEVIQLLLDCGASANAQDNWGHTPRFQASARSHVEVAQLLRERGG
jgi:ankyrin repeat protein